MYRPENDALPRLSRAVQTALPGLTTTYVAIIDWLPSALRTISSAELFYRAICRYATASRRRNVLQCSY